MTEEAKNLVFMQEGDYAIVHISKFCDYKKEGVAVWFAPDHPLNRIICSDSKSTADFQAFAEAIHAAYKNGVSKLKIKTDKKNVYKSMARWIYKLKKNGLQTVKKTAVRDTEDVKVLDHSCKLLDNIILERVGPCKGAKMFAKGVLRFK